MDLTAVGKWLLIVGLGVAGLGLVVWLAGKSGLPAGRLPGDLHVRGERWSFHFPLVTCILLSIALTIVVNLVGRFFR